MGAARRAENNRQIVATIDKYQAQKEFASLSMYGNLLTAVLSVHEQGGTLVNLSKSEMERHVDSLSQKGADDGQQLALFLRKCHLLVGHPWLAAAMAKKRMLAVISFGTGAAKR
jgi:hypothetical protein